MFLCINVNRYIVKRLKSQTKCKKCLNAMQIVYGHSSHQAADLTNLKTRGYLIQPNHQIYLLIKSLESCFEKYADNINVFEETQEEFFNNHSRNLKWECSLHKIDIFTNIFVMFITMRMRQYSYTKNIESKKLNRTKKKLSKLVTS